MRVRIGAGTGVDTLIAAAAVADPGWRSVFDQGAATYAAARRAGGAVLLRDIGRFGRFGWINLVGALTAGRGPWSREALVDLVATSTPQDLHVRLVGGHRHQLGALVEPGTVRAAVAGDPGARRRLRTALASDRTVLQVTPWLLRAESTAVQVTLRQTLEALPGPTGPAPDARLTRARSRQVGPESLLDEVAPGVHYGPDVLGRVVLVTSAQVSPVLVVVDEPGRTVIVHPPLGDQGPMDAGTRLRDLGRAVGDTTRMRLLRELKPGPRTLLDLCRVLDSPRTTLLHHLALLRAAGLVDIAVPATGPNVYTLRPDGFESFAQVVKGFSVR